MTLTYHAQTPNDEWEPDTKVDKPCESQSKRLEVVEPQVTQPVDFINEAKRCLYNVHENKRPPKKYTLLRQQEQCSFQLA